MKSNVSSYLHLIDTICKIIIAKTKGFSQNMNQISSLLCVNVDTKSDKNNLRNLISNLLSTRKSVNAMEIVIKDYNSIRVDPTKFSCYYYDFIYGKTCAVNNYNGEYMLDYSWAAFSLSKTIKKQL